MNAATATKPLNPKLLSYFIYHKPLQHEEFVAMHTMKDGEVICKQGNHPAGVYYIREGKVKFSCFAESGTHHIFHIAKEGDYIGYRDVLLNKRYSYSVVAWGEASVYFISHRLFKNVLDHNFQASSKFCKMLCEDLLESEERLIGLSRMGVKARLADALLQLKNYVNGSSTIVVPRMELAQMIGTATETVIRMLSDFHDEKLVDTSRRGEIKILNVKGLTQLTTA